MNIVCPHCHSTLEGDSSLTGNTVTCPGCGQDFTVPKVLAARSASTAVPSVASSKQPNAWKWVAIGMSLVAMFVVGMAVGMFLPMRNKSGIATSSQTQQNKPKPKPRPNIEPLPDPHLDWSQWDIKSLEWLDSCREAYFEDIMRFPEKHKGKPFYVFGTTVAVFYPDPEDQNHRGTIWMRQDGDWKTEWYIVFDDERSILPEGKILKGDTICVLGTFEETVERNGGHYPLLMARAIGGDTDNDEDFIRNMKKEVRAALQDLRQSPSKRRSSK